MITFFMESGIIWHIGVVIICISLMARDFRHLFMYSSVICISSVKCLFISAAHFYWVFNVGDLIILSCFYGLGFSLLPKRELAFLFPVFRFSIHFAAFSLLYSENFLFDRIPFVDPYYAFCNWSTVRKSLPTATSLKVLSI